VGISDSLKYMLSSFGYEIDSDGNIRPSINQMGCLSIEESDEEGILHLELGESDFLPQKTGNVAVPVKINKIYTYFQGDDAVYRIRNRELFENLALALMEADKDL